MQENNERVLDKYIIIKKIGSGSFGEVYLANDHNNNLVAAKVESTKDKDSNTNRMLIEYNIYKRLYHRGFRVGIPEIYKFMITKDYNFMVMELLGPNLEELFEKCNKQFKIETVILLGSKILDLIERLHKVRYIHRDIKPNNFMIGYGSKSSELYIMDFGLSKQYMDKDGKHMEYSDERSLIGTARYASINMHLGIEPSRRCDLVSIGYMLIYLAKGKLPWQGIKKSNNTDQFKAIGEKKLLLSDEQLCDNLPTCFIQYMTYVKNLKFDEEPNYNYLKALFEEHKKILQISDTYKFEWQTLTS